MRGREDAHRLGPAAALHEPAEALVQLHRLRERLWGFGFMFLQNTLTLGECDDALRRMR